MRTRIAAVTLCLCNTIALSIAAFAEERAYGDVELTGQAQRDWQYNPPGVTNAMVCNVNGPDSFVTIRAEPTANSRSVRKLERLAILEVDTRTREGHWVKVVGGHRTYSKDGQQQALKELSVRGWVHEDYLCSFLD